MFWSRPEKCLLEFVSSVHSCLSHSIWNIVERRLRNNVTIIFQPSQNWWLGIRCEFELSSCILEIYHVTWSEIHVGEVILLSVYSLLLISLVELDVLLVDWCETIDTSGGHLFISDIRKVLLIQ